MSASILASALVFSCTSLSVSAVDITLGVKDNSPVDIVLASGETDFDTDNFKGALEIALRKNNVDLNRVNILASETSVMDMANTDPQVILKSWTKWGDKDANYVYDSVHNAIRDQVYHCLRSGYYNHTAPIIKNSKITMSADITGYTHTCNNYFGFTFNQQGSRDYYAVVWQDTAGTKCGMMAGQPYVGLAIIKVKGCGIAGGQCYEGTHDSRCQHATTLAYNNETWIPSNPNGSNPRPYHWDVEFNRGTITVKIDGITKLTYTDPNPLPAGQYGFISVGHTSGGIFQNIVVKQSSVRDLVEVVRAPDWRPQSHRFIVDAVDAPREDILTESKLGEIAQRVAADGAYYVGLGLDSSQVSIKSFISRNNSKGLYLNNNSSDVYDKLAKYIASIVNSTSKEKGTLYLTKDKQYEFSTKVS